MVFMEATFTTAMTDITLDVPAHMVHQGFACVALPVGDRYPANIVGTYLTVDNAVATARSFTSVTGRRCVVVPFTSGRVRLAA